MSAAADLMTDPEAAAAAPAILEPHVRGESLYDRVTSGLIASVTGAALIFAWLSLIWITQQAYASRVTAPIEIIEVSGGGGDPNGELGSTQSFDMAGADAADQASNSDAEAADYEDPTVMETPETTIDEVAADTQDAMDEGLDFDIPVMGASSVVAGGKRASKLGKGLPGLGTGGGGDGGVRREDRWSVIYPSGQTIDEYAKQLDFMKVELGTTAGNVLTIASNFSTTPTRRIGNPSGEGRLYFMWQGGSRKGSDITLLQKAGITVGAAPVFQFYPKEVEDKLVQLEVRYKNRQPGEIRSTKFSVVPVGGKYGFQVLSQEPLR